MGRCRFVRPEIVRVSLSDGEWIEVKRELNAGEQNHLEAGYVKDMRMGERPTLDYERVGKTRILEYVTGWSFCGFNGQPEPFDESALDALDMDTYLEIMEAIRAHEVDISARREARKNGQAGENRSSPISPLPFAVAGASSGSAP
jgi:hypothetical protein